MKNNNQQKHVHCIGIWGIGLSALARYYKSIGYRVTGSDAADFSFRSQLESEGISVSIGNNSGEITETTEKIIFSEAIITRPDFTYEQNLKNNPELSQAIEKNIPYISYPKALAEIFNSSLGIAVSGTHGKSTTTSLLGKIFKNSNIPSTTIVGTLVKEFWNSNFYTSGSDACIIEACEYKRSFLSYLPKITIITNIELDHLDYYKDEKDYISAFSELQKQTKNITILPGDDSLAKKLFQEEKTQVWVYDDFFEITGDLSKTPFTERKIFFPNIPMSLPGDHILFDAKLAYVAAKICNIPDEISIPALSGYSGAWRRMEEVGITESKNILVSDYGHHPTEIRLTLPSIQKKYPDKKLCVIFQPHQYSRTIELLEDFKTCFSSADELIIPDIYFSRDSKKDVENMPPKKFVQEISTYFPEVIFGNGLENTRKIIQEKNKKNPDTYVFVLLGAGNVDNLRFSIQTKK